MQPQRQFFPSLSVPQVQILQTQVVVGQFSMDGVFILLSLLVFKRSRFPKEAALHLAFASILAAASSASTVRFFSSRSAGAIYAGAYHTSTFLIFFGFCHI
jgi:hypothetical protein